MKKTYETPDLQVECYEIESEMGICVSGAPVGYFGALDVRPDGVGEDGIEDGE